MKIYIDHPTRPGNKIFLLFDSVHVFKNIFNNLLNRKEFFCPPFEGESLSAKMVHVKQLYALELEQGVRFAYKLTDQVLNPQSIERTKVKLADSFFHDSTINGLHQLDKHGQWKETAAFLSLIRRWWNCVNVQGRWKSVHKRDERCAPITAVDRRQIDFLNEFEQWLGKWEDAIKAEVKSIRDAKKQKQKEYEPQQITDLKVELKKCGLSDGGNEQDLRDRLMSFLSEHPDNYLNQPWDHILGSPPQRSHVQEWIAFQKKKWEHQRKHKMISRFKSLSVSPPDMEVEQPEEPGIELTEEELTAQVAAEVEADVAASIAIANNQRGKVFPIGLTTETFLAARQTSKGLAELAEYLLDEKLLDYVLLGKVNSDKIEKRYGWYREIAGACYHISVRQVLEGEKKIRVRCLVKFNRLSMAEIGEIFKVTDSSRIDEETTVLLSMLPTEQVLENPLDDGEEGIVFYIAGYISRSILKRKNIHGHKCDSCIKMLTGDKELSEVEFLEDHGDSALQKAKEDFLKSIDRGGLVEPSELVYLVCTHALQLRDVLFKGGELQNTLLQTSCPQSVFVRVLINMIENKPEASVLFDQQCEKEHKFKDLIPTIAAKFFNCLSKNFAAKVNDEIHASKSVPQVMGQKSQKKLRIHLRGR